MADPPEPVLTDPLHLPGDPDTHWSCVNVGEALPGVCTPLGWSIWADIGEQMCRDISYAIGVFDRHERRQPLPGPDRIINPFFGRVAIRMEWLALVGDRMPGTTGEVAISGMLGEAPATMAFAPTRARYPVIAYRLPKASIVSTREVRKLAPVVDAWWRSEVRRLPDRDLPDAVAAFAEASGWFSRTMTAHGTALFAAITPLINALEALIKRTGVGDVGALSGTGGAEMKMVEDLWLASRNRLTLEQVVAAHGYHGPLEGEISSRVWREDPAPLAAMVERYAGRDESAGPLAREAEARARVPGIRAELLAALPAVQRPAVRALLAHAARTIPLRGLGKASFLQALDVARAAARRVGEHHALAGRLGEPDDVFYLTVSELLGALPCDVADVVAYRRKKRAEYQGLSLPQYWRGIPLPVEVGPASETGDEVLTGLGVGSGVVEGPVRVVTDPSFAEVEASEVLVAPTTDPSWASIMFVSAALVVDIGSVLSHAAVVARELGLPCVVNTRNGTRRLRDGDLVRVDGSAGTVEILRRAGS